MGRANREFYWYFLGFTVVLIGAAWALFHGRPYIAAPAALLCVPRLHDIGRTGWIALAAFIAGVLLSDGLTRLFGAGQLTLGVPLAEALLSGGFLAVFLVSLGVIPGQPGANRYGPPSDWRVGGLFGANRRA